MGHFQETLVTIILVVATALFLGGSVWRLYRGDPDVGRRR